MRIMLILLVAAVAVVLLNAGCAAVRGGYASAPYRVVKKDGAFEVREYPGLVLVETPMRGQDNSFMRLFRYIGGQNSASRKIAMTTPVFMAPGATNGTMAFVLPASLPLAEAPQPSGPEVRVREMPGGRFAVRRYSGGINSAREAKELARLRAWLAAGGLTAVDGPVYGYFDPPWTPPFWRRNEVMLRLVP